jgi:copper homeostasis protein
MKLEVVVYNIESAFKAMEGGADRIEVCADPGAGGTTPSMGTVEVIRQNVSLDVYVMLRPRGGDFIYSSYEFHAMKRDLGQLQRLSVDGVVFGILNNNGTIDKKRCAELIQRARPLKVTCHRAFDMTRDPMEALEDCIEVGFDRILTSGQHTTALEGVDVIANVRKSAGNRIVIMAGSGVNESTVREIVSKSGVDEIHFSASDFRKSSSEFVNVKLRRMGNDPRGEYDIRTVSPEVIRNIRSIVSSL